MSDAQPAYGQIGRATLLIIVLSMVGKVLAVLKEMLVAARFGTSAELDVFNVAYGYPAILVLFLSGALVSALVPFYLEWCNRSRDYANANTLALFHLGILAFGLLTLLSYLLNPIIYPVFGYGFSDPQKALTIVFGNMMVLLIFLDGIAIIPAGILHAKKQFVVLNVAPNFINIATVLLLLWCYERLGIYALVWGFLIGAAAKFLYMALALHLSGFSFLGKPIFNSSALLGFVTLALPLLGSEMIANVIIFIDQVMATKLAAGSVSALRYAYRLNDMPIQIVILAVSKAIFPFLSEHAIDKNRTALRDIFKNVVVAIGFLTLPITCFFILYSQDLVSILFQRGAFDPRAVDQTAQILVYYGLGLFFYAYSFVNATFFSALKDARPLLLVGCLSIVLNVGFNALFMALMGVKGIALSTSVTLVIVCSLFVMMLKRRLEIDRLGVLLGNILRITAGCLIMGMVGAGAKAIEPWVPMAHYVYLAISVVCVILVYLFSVWTMRTEELTRCFDILGFVFRVHRLDR